MPSAEKDACVSGSVLTDVVADALADAERAGMTGRTRAEWVSIAILASPRVPLRHHFPPEGGGPCPVCDTYVIPEGWLPFGSLIDYHGPAECSEETGEDGLPLWERPLPPDLTTELADRLVVRANELLEDNDG